MKRRRWWHWLTPAVPEQDPMIPTNGLRVGNYGRITFGQNIYSALGRPKYVYIGLYKQAGETDDVYNFHQARTIMVVTPGQQRGTFASRYSVQATGKDRSSPQIYSQTLQNNNALENGYHGVLIGEFQGQPAAFFATIKTND